MGFDKSLAKISNKYIIETLSQKLFEVFDTVKLSAVSKEKFNMFDLEVVEDILKGKGPSGAIHTVLSQATTKYVFVVACDMPFVNVEHIRFKMAMIKGKEKEGSPVDGLIPKKGELFEPLYGFYSADIAAVFEKELLKGTTKILDVIKNCNMLYLEDEYSRQFDKNLSMFTNLNYREDFDGVVKRCM